MEYMGNWVLDGQKSHKDYHMPLYSVPRVRRDDGSIIAHLVLDPLSHQEV